MDTRQTMFAAMPELNMGLDSTSIMKICATPPPSSLHPAAAAFALRLSLSLSPCFAMLRGMGTLSASVQSTELSRCTPFSESVPPLICRRRGGLLASLLGVWRFRRSDATHSSLHPPMCMFRTLCISLNVTNSRSFSRALSCALSLSLSLSLSLPGKEQGAVLPPLRARARTRGSWGVCLSPFGHCPKRARLDRKGLAGFVESKIK